MYGGTELMTTRENPDAPRTKRATEPRIPLPADDLAPTSRGMMRSTDDISVVGIVTPAPSSSSTENVIPAEKDFLEFTTHLNTVQLIGVVTLAFLVTGSVILTIMLLAGAF